MKTPRLRSVEKYKPPYELNKFPSSFAMELGKEIVYLLATRKSPRLEGSDWEEMFAAVIGADWHPSNVGLDDVVLEQCAWGAKTVKSHNPVSAKKVRLISGRNSPIYSFGDVDIEKGDPNELGAQVLEIWNERVSSVRRKYKHLRTVVLLKSSDLLEVAVFELETIRFETKEHEWSRNQRGNLDGYDKTGRHRFVWQPHGSQFTLIEEVPSSRLALRIRPPSQIDKNALLEVLKFDPSWVEVL